MFVFSLTRVLFLLKQGGKKRKLLHLEFLIVFSSKNKHFFFFFLLVCLLVFNDRVLSFPPHPAIVLCPGKLTAFAFKD